MQRIEKLMLGGLEGVFSGFLLATVIAGIVGCGDGTIVVTPISTVDTEEPETSTDDERMQEILDEIADDGGFAVLVSADTEALLEVTDTDSPIFGTKVRIPAGALPSGVSSAVLYVVPTSVTDSDDYGVAGPGVQIELEDVKDRAKVTLIADATVELPIDANALEQVDADADAGDTGAGHWVDDAWSALPGTDHAEDGSTVSGLTRSFSPFAAVLAIVTPVTPPAPASTNTLTYAVKQTGETICSNSMSLVGNVSHAFSYALHTTGTYNIQFKAGTLDNNTHDDGVDLFGEYADEGVLAQPVAPTDGSDTSMSDLRVTCGSFEAFNYTGSNVSVKDITFSAWETTMTVDTVCSYWEIPCTVHYGKVRVQAEFAFVDDNDSSYSGTATLDHLFPNATWDVQDTE